MEVLLKFANYGITVIKECVTDIDEETIEALEEAFVYQGVSKYPARIKCAALPWKALEEVLINHEQK